MPGGDDGGEDVGGAGALEQIAAGSGLEGIEDAPVLLGRCLDAEADVRAAAAEGLFAAGVDAA